VLTFLVRLAAGFFVSTIGSLFTEGRMGEEKVGGWLTTGSDITAGASIKVDLDFLGIFVM
jgi:hypothetical protein